MEFFKIDHNELLKEKLDLCIKKACSDLYLNDYELIATGKNQKDHVAEQSIVFRFGIYLDKHLSKYKSLNKYHLDSEYNRNIDDLKRLPSRPNGCSPDLIIHKRGSNDHNLLVIECKGWWSLDNKVNEDGIKVMNFIEDTQFNYKFGLLIIFEKEGANIKWIDKYIVNK